MTLIVETLIFVNILIIGVVSTMIHFKVNPFRVVKLFLDHGFAEADGLFLLAVIALATETALPIITILTSGFNVFAASALMIFSLIYLSVMSLWMSVVGYRAYTMYFSTSPYSISKHGEDQVIRRKLKEMKYPENCSYLILRRAEDEETNKVLFEVYVERSGF